MAAWWDEGCDFTPLVPILERFASEHQTTLSYVDEEDPWTGPHYRLGWVNSHGETCFARVEHWSDKLRVVVLRWGPQRLEGSQDWETSPEPSDLQRALHEAYRWSHRAAA